MERHDTTTRTARCLIATGALAAVMLVMTSERAAAQTEDCVGEFPTVCGHVFTETPPGDNLFQVGEGTPDVQVVVTDSKGTPVMSTTSQLCTDGVDQPGCGFYFFSIETPEPFGGNYLVCIVLDGQSSDCSNAIEHPETLPITSLAPLQKADFEVPSDEPPPPSDVWGVGTGTPGYWKNHPEAWPAEGVMVGGVTYLNQKTAPAGKFTIYDAIKLMGKVGGDKSLTIFASLISAKLNSTLQNNTTCVAPTIALADAWMTAHPAGSGVKASSDPWRIAEPWHTLMDDYNNGKLCAPHRD
jgi:hypothetical protein